MSKVRSPKQEAQKRQKRLMKKRIKDIVRHKAHGTSGAGENAIQHQMLSEFGSVENFVKNVHHLAVMFKEEEELKTLRLDAKAIYDKLDPADPDTHEALTDLYSNDDLTYYAEQYEHFWKQKRGDILPDLITEELAGSIAKLFKVLLRKKRGFKKDYRAILAGNLLIQSHVAALTEAPVGENNLWEIMFTAALKENKAELPAKRERAAPSAGETTEEAAKAEAEKPEAPPAAPEGGQ